MNIKAVFGMSALALILAGCENGDINVDAANRSTADNSVKDSYNGGSGNGSSTPPPSTSNPCASYSAGGSPVVGSYRAPHCYYDESFTGLTNPIEAEETVTFRDLADDGIHIFQTSLVVGRGFDSDADLTAAGITEGGDGASITIEAGATLAFDSTSDYMVINRGSQIFATGTQTAPITFTSTSDAVDGSVEPEDVSQWGGIIINGFAVTNKCAYTGARGSAELATENCHVAAEGRSGSAQTYYGGANDADNSGVLNYVVVKHTGAQVAPDNELNGISFNAVGRGTEVRYLQTYSTYDDGIEMFGGSVDIEYFVAMYVRDDSIDIDEGYNGTISHALVVQSATDGNHCVESDGIGSYSSLEESARADLIARGLHSAATITNMTCIISAQAEGTHDPGAGVLIREGHHLMIQDSIITTAYSTTGLPDSDADNYCVRIADAETLRGAEAGDVSINSSIIACSNLTRSATPPNGTDIEAWLASEAFVNQLFATDPAGQNPTAASDNGLTILDGVYSVSLADMIVDSEPTSVISTIGADYIGAVSQDDDWIADWVFGLQQGEPLWFE